MTDAQGLEEAYGSLNNSVVHNGVMYIAGTHTLDDWRTNMHIPFNLQDTARFKQAENLFKLYRPHTVVGHSLGGAIAKTLSDRYYSAQHGRARYYGAPFFLTTKLRPWETSYRHYGDPVSVFGPTTGTQSTVHVGFNPHEYASRSSQVGH